MFNYNEELLPRQEINKLKELSEQTFEYQLLKENLYFEGKKQALAILGGNKEQVDQLAELDPSSSNKYVELFAKFIKSGSSMNDIKTLIPLISKAEEKRTAIDIGKFNKLEDFKQAITGEAQKVTRKALRQGVAGLTEGVDYLDFGEIQDIKGTTYYGYIPLHWKASKALGSDVFNGVEGKWCTSANEPGHWNSYVKKNKNIFIYLYTKDNVPQKNKRLAAQFDKNGKPINVWDQGDSSHSFSEYFN